MIEGARAFVFAPGVLDAHASSITFRYRVEMLDGSEEIYTDTLQFPSVTAGRWKDVPEDIVRRFCENLSLACGVSFWRIHCADDIKLEGFSITPVQAAFWKEVYEKGLAEYFYKSKIDFRGRIRFPADAVSAPPLVVRRRTDRALVMQGGGKDSVVTAETLKSHDVPFSILMIGRTRMQDRVSEAIGNPIIRVLHQRNPILMRLHTEGKIRSGIPLTTIQMFIAVFVGVLLDYRYAIFSNEHGADVANLEYLGMPVNHQWSKSTESELLVRKYISEFLTADVTPFSLIHQYTELFMVREFAKHERYFKLFSSCNRNFYIPYEKPGVSEEGRAYWCNACPKCAFIFAGLSAFLPKASVLDIFGKNLYADEALLPTFKMLLGHEGFKPFECVGTPEEMKVAMMLAHKRGEYDADPAMSWYISHGDVTEATLKSVTEPIFSTHGNGTIPQDFDEAFLHGRLFGR